MIRPQLFQHFSSPPIYAMAFDELLLWQAEQEPDAVYLRLYSWQPGGITIGYNQRLETAIDWTMRGETSVIRRVTGGRALYHDCAELTYSVAINLHAIPDTDAATISKRTSERIAEGIVAFLKTAGISAQFLRASQRISDVSSELHKAPCFASHARHEIVSDIGKIVASAARITPKAFFQHGSIKLNGVVEHPALALPASVQQNVTSATLTVDDFGKYAEPFFDSLTASLAMEKGILGTTSADSTAFLDSRLDLIQADPTRKRVPN